MNTTYLLIAFSISFFIGLAGLFKKAGEQSWKALIPIYNIYVWIKIVNKPWWWLFLAFIPVVNVVLFIGLTVEILNYFGKRKVYEHVIGAIAGYLSLWSVFWAFKLITGKEGMGYGDFKLNAAIGAWLGWQSKCL